MVEKEKGKMAAYDIFLRNSHTYKIAKMMINNNCRLLEYLCTFVKSKEITVLEIGPGKGYFKEAVLIRGVLNITL